MMPSVAVLIPTKNRKTLLERALQSVLKQTIPPEEIIIVNDGSTDDTREFLQNFSNIQVISREHSGGVNTARNEGIKIANSEWVAFLDDDDEFVPEAIQIMKEKIATLPTAFNVVYFNSKIIDDQGAFVGGFQFDQLKEKKDFYDPTYEDTMTKFNLWRDCKQVLRKKIFLEEKYKFPETVNGFESYTMNLIARDGKGVRYYPDVLTHIHQESTLQDRLSLTAPRKSPWPMFLLHSRQLSQHFRFYLSHPLELLKKKVTMFKLLLKTIS